MDTGRESLLTIGKQSQTLKVNRRARVIIHMLAGGRGFVGTRADTMIVGGLTRVSRAGV